jgi:hypothetical protein
MSSPYDAEPPAYSEPVPEPAELNEPATIMQEFPPASPFGTPEPSIAPTPEPVFPPAPAAEVFRDPEPFEPAVATPVQQNEPGAWTPPPAPVASWENQDIGQNTPFQPPVAGGSVNQTLPIISLVLGILSLCCYIAPVTGIAALITGYLGMRNIKKDPNVYGGKVLAMIGMIAGGVFALVGLAYYIYLIVVFGMVFLGR